MMQMLISNIHKALTKISLIFLLTSASSQLIHVNVYDDLFLSFNGHPSLVREVELLIDALHVSPWFLNSSSSVQLDLDVLLHNLRPSAEEHDVFSLVEELTFGEESVGDTGLVTEDASEPGSNSLSRNDLSYE